MSDQDNEHDADNPNLDPSPDQDNDLEAGGGVKPGHTPPDSHSASMPPTHTPSPRPPRHRPTLLIIGVLLAFLVFIFIAYGIGLWN